MISFVYNSEFGFFCKKAVRKEVKFKNVANLSGNLLACRHLPNIIRAVRLVNLFISQLDQTSPRRPLLSTAGNLSP